MACRTYAAAGGWKGWVGERGCRSGVRERWGGMVAGVKGGCGGVSEEGRKFGKGIIF